MPPENGPSRSNSRAKSTDIIGIPHKSIEIGPDIFKIADTLVGTIPATSLVGHPPDFGGRVRTEKLR